MIAGKQEGRIEDLSDVMLHLVNYIQLCCLDYINISRANEKKKMKEKEGREKEMRKKNKMEDERRERRKDGKRGANSSEGGSKREQT